MDREDVKEEIVSFLPGLSLETLTSLLGVLEELGVESRADLAFVEAKDLEKYLRPIQCRRLLNGIKNKDLPPVEVEDHVAVESPPLTSTPLSSSEITSNSSFSSSTMPGRPWYTDFRVRWEEMPAAIGKATADEKRPSPGDRRDMIKTVVDQMLVHEQNPTRATCHTIARMIVRDWPKSFADVGQKGDMLGDGCYSLLQQIKTRVEYKNRNQTLQTRRRRQRRPSNVAAEGAIAMARGPVDQYGCVRWCPEELPAGETEATLEEKKQQLLNIYAEGGMGGAETAEHLMEKTYITQRQFINRVPAPAIAEIKEDWPFLFSQRGLFSHFSLLTDVSIQTKYEEAMNSKGSTIIRFCQQLNRSGIKDVLAKYEPEASDKAACVLLLLMAYFKEPKNAIMLEADVSCLKKKKAGCDCIRQLLKLLSLLIAPNFFTIALYVCSLFFSGDMMKPTAWMLSIEQKVVVGPHHSFSNGIAAMFASYYCFNLQYPEEGSSTLEFIQRCFLSINPERGSKAKKKRGLMNPHVSTLLRKILDFEWISM
ncbi:uncharacterized protein LOC132463678 [Gadus macrocephalus]|uniref:uncharacterized protein LOC132463678 n=1 Tax=Gadus macrocephalus TaxID=80720 RepID=UPI0028CBA840|nr:uncharacterized protein LOC132463678 [Gadus macrocephalus]